jgi:hypothetical protein
MLLGNKDYFEVVIFGKLADTEGENRVEVTILENKFPLRTEISICKDVFFLHQEQKDESKPLETPIN